MIPLIVFECGFVIFIMIIVFIVRIQKQRDTVLLDDVENPHDIDSFPPDSRQRPLKKIHWN